MLLCSFFESIDRIAKPDYLPDNNDMLRVRKKTTGVLETKFETGGLFFRLDWLQPNVPTCVSLISSI